MSIDPAAILKCQAIVHTANTTWGLTNYGDGYSWLRGARLTSGTTVSNPTLGSTAQTGVDGSAAKSCLTFLGNLLSRSTVLSVGKKIAENRAGCCTTCAVGVAGLMLEENLDEKMRIEIVSQGEGNIHNGHTFLLLGRVGVTTTAGTGIKKKKIISSSYSNWGADAFIIDVWLGILGNEGIYMNVATAGPHNRFIDFVDLAVSYDSTA